MIENTPDKFKFKLKKFHRSAGVRVGTAARQTAIVGLREAILSSPVATGNLRASWNISLNTPDLKTVETGSKKSPAKKPLSGIRLPAVKTGDTIYITNNINYAKIIDQGSVKRAPANMVQGALAAMKRHLKNINIEED